MPTYQVLLSFKNIPAYTTLQIYINKFEKFPHFHQSYLVVPTRQEILAGHLFHLQERALKTKEALTSPLLPFELKQL